ncbi:A/G-specific adenine glycosylase [Sphingomonas quercus]|uniref:Adenine DNA glycosylase n=1 Tax=Sphingomonas quercus TaxID=2842451 RepID=A0ABS6BL95_9SPHN|nr:A/G-specific adenine glycosylase [Sphingomonas quercus]MBU3077995.1 A/G-specific adenine glycosylase [Sphingomonas quercus]
MSVDGAAPALLSWYDVHARALPWRAPPGAPPADPYRVWLSEIMLQQTTVAAVRPYFARFTERWPDVAALATADEGELMAAWAGLGYYARARNLLACARAVAKDHGGRFPDSEQGLRALPGIGRYTAAAVAAIAFGRRAVVVDGNVERVVARLFAVEEALPAARPRLHALADRLTPARRTGDFAQAMMDLGATICTPRQPACAICPLMTMCAGRATGDPARFPVKAPKAARPQRRGTAFWLERDGEVLLCRRPARGLLGGMLALPSGPWTADDPGLAGAPAEAGWRDAGHIAHVFTHFALDLRVVTALTGERTIAGQWWPVERLAEAGLPTVFAKAAERARSLMEIA